MAPIPLEHGDRLFYSDCSWPDQMCQKPQMMSSKFKLWVLWLPKIKKRKIFLLKRDSQGSLRAVAQQVLLMANLLAGMEPSMKTSRAQRVRQLAAVHLPHQLEATPPSTEAVRWSQTTVMSSQS